MSSIPTPENSALVYDFTAEIAEAIENAPIVGVSPSGKIDMSSQKHFEMFGRFADESETVAIDNGDDTQPGDIVIDSAHAYPVLIRQAWEMTHPALDARAINALIKESLDHEMAHSAAAAMIGLAVRYGIRIIKITGPDAKKRTLLASFINFDDSQLTKADLAFIAAAPEKRSEADELLIRSLGYTSCEQALDTHPLFANNAKPVEPITAS